MARKITTEIFISDAKVIHGDKYDYSKTEYKRNDEKVCIICPKHGEFWQTPSNHKHEGCPKCAAEKKMMSKERFITESKEKFGDKFNYSLLPDYCRRKDKVTLICPIHGEFQTCFDRHIISPTGCTKCSRTTPRKPVVEGIKRKEMREYSIWKAIKTRVLNPNTDDSSRYINRGITCCQEWLNSFEQFYKDMGACPEGYSIDRIDPNGNYCPENCRWANNYTQSQNRGDFNIVINYNGESHVLKEWCRILGLRYGTIYNRMFHGNLSFEDAIKDDPFNKKVTFHGETNTLAYFCNKYNIKYQTVINRIHKHKWSLEEALLTPYRCKKHKI